MGHNRVQVVALCSSTQYSMQCSSAATFVQFSCSYAQTAGQKACLAVTALHGWAAAAYCKALKVDPSSALLLDVAFPQHSPWESAAL